MRNAGTPPRPQGRPGQARRQYDKAVEAAFRHTKLASDRALQRDLVESVAGMREALEMIREFTKGGELPPPTDDDPFAGVRHAEDGSAPYPSGGSPQL
ncbi:hypothetical protein ACIBQ1_56445 [Nonomuraea sp. NPDC050153]|uniref:hypothetical protein n=1 Tax=Nonomuraea sp. NPDC050153 TaxID=3364359 RepID=UPI0037B8D4CE